MAKESFPCLASRSHYVDVDSNLDCKHIHIAELDMIHDQFQSGDELVNCRTSPVGCYYNSHESDCQVVPVCAQCSVRSIVSVRMRYVIGVIVPRVRWWGWWPISHFDAFRARTRSSEERGVVEVC